MEKLTMNSKVIWPMFSAWVAIRLVPCVIAAVSFSFRAAMFPKPNWFIKSCSPDCVRA